MDGHPEEQMHLSAARLQTAGALPVSVGSLEQFHGIFLRVWLSTRLSGVGVASSSATARSVTVSPCQPRASYGLLRRLLILLELPVQHAVLLPRMEE